MDVILSRSCTVEKDFITINPIDGKAALVKGRVKSGMWTKTIAMAKISDNKKKGSPSIKPGALCSQYGPGGSGSGVIIQSTKAKDGGTSGVPYIQEIVTIKGAS